MKLNIKNIFIILLGILGFAGVVYAAPTQTFLRNTLPEANNTYDLGSTTPNLRWKNVYTTNLDVSGTCTGCGGGSLSGGIANTLTYWINSTTVGATSSPTIGWITATSTTATSTFASDVQLANLFIGGATVPSSLSSTGAVFWPNGSKLLEQTSTQRFSVLPNGDRFELLNEIGSTFIAGFHGASSALSNSIRLYNAVGIGDAAGYAQSGTLPSNGLLVLGNTGIGTTSPGQKLSVAGDILGNNHIGSYFTATSSTATSTFAGGSLFAFSGGNVGIGTTSPQARLTVSEPNFGVNSTNLGRLSNSILLETKATVVGAGSEITFGGLGNLKSATGIYAAISAPVTGNNAASGAAGYLAFSTKGSTVATVLTEAMRITGGQLIGMGTTSPTTVLTVDSSTNSSLWIDPNTTYNGIAFGGKRGSGGWSGGFSFVGNSAGGNAALGGFNAIGGTGLTRLVIGTVTTNELMSILAGGNIGIGTTTPAQKLEVYKTSGDLYARLDANQSTADIGYILNNSGSNTNSWAVKRNNTTGTFSINRSSATFPTTGTITQPFTINTTDNIGIGTTTMFSQNELTIANGSGPQISLVDGGTASNAWAFRVMPSGDLAFATSSSATGATTTPNAILFSATGVGLSVGATSTNPVAFATFETANNPRTYQFYLGSSTKTSLVVDNAGAMFAPNTASSGSAQTGYWCYDGSGQFVRTSTTCLVSAERFKTKITTLDSGINELLKLRPVSYFKKNPLDKADSYEQIGFIAEEAEKVDSRLISYGNDGTIRGFRYDQFTALITKAIQDIWHKITGYDQKIAKLEKDNAELKARLDKLEKKINAIKE